MSSIPCHPNEMTPAWLEQKLHAPTGTLDNMTYAPIGTGQMCDSFRLQLFWNDHQGPATVIAKCPSADDHSRAIAKMVRNYELEVSWYANLSATTLVNCPHCYHAEMHEGGIDFALLLEDRAPARQGDQLAGADIRALKAAIAELAALHSSHWNSKALAAYEFLQFGSANKEIVRQLLPTLYPEFCRRYAGRLDSTILATGQHLVDRLGYYLDAVPAALTIVHGDFRLDNLLFGPGDAVTVVDWQTVGAGPPMADLAYFIGTSIADPHVRRTHERALFEHYCDLIESNEISIDRAEQWTDFRRYAYSGFIMAVFASMNVARTDRGDEMFAVMAQRPAQQIIDLDSANLLQPAM
jgi:hypothetical protein